MTRELIDKRNNPNICKRNNTSPSVVNFRLCYSSSSRHAGSDDPSSRKGTDDARNVKMTLQCLCIWGPYWRGGYVVRRWCTIPDGCLQPLYPNLGNSGPTPKNGEGHGVKRIVTVPYPTINGVPTSTPNLLLYTRESYPDYELLLSKRWDEEGRRGQV